MLDGRSEHLAHRAYLLQLAVPKHGEPIAECESVLDVVGHADHDEMPLELQGAKVGPQPLPQSRIQRGEGLVEQQDLGVPGQRPGDGHPLLLSSRELMREAVSQLAKPHLLDECLGALLGRGFPPQRVADVAEYRQVRKEGVALKHVTNATAARRHVGVCALSAATEQHSSIEDDLSPVGGDEPGDGLEGHRLSGTGGAEQDEHLLAHLQTEVEGEGRKAPVDVDEKPGFAHCLEPATSCGLEGNCVVRKGV